MGKIKAAQIGTSVYSHGNPIFDSLKKNKDFFEIAGYVLPENEDKKFPYNMPSFDGYKRLTLDEVLNDPEIEAVVIETEEIYLGKYAQLAADAKKHIHLEKPGAMDLSSFERIVETAKRNNTTLHMGYMYRYNPYISRLTERVKSGELGEIISIEAHMSGYHPTDTRRWLKDFPCGMMFFLGCHLIDLIIQLQGIPERIIPLNKKTGIEGVDSTDFGMVVFEYKNGVSFAKATDIEHGGFLRRQLVVTGSKGTIEVRPLEENVNYPDTITRYRESFDTNWNFKPEEHTTEVFDRYDNMMVSFAQMVCGEKQNPWSYDYEIELYKILAEACGIKK